MLQNVFYKQPLKEFMLSRGLLTDEQWMDVEARVEADGIAEIVAASKAYGSNSDVTIALAEYAKVPHVLLRELPRVSPDVLQEIPRKMIYDAHIFPFAYGDDKSVIRVACVDPNDNDAIESVGLRSGKAIERYHASWADIDAMLVKYYGTADAIEAANAYAQSIQTSARDFSAYSLDSGSESPIVTIVNSIIEQATKVKASDIHIEPFESHLRIRYRIDGALVERPSFAMTMHSAIIARVKVMAGMDIAEKRVPQDGRITFMVNKVEYDIRVSMLPTVYGEKCVMRLAIRSNLQLDKSELGLTPYDLKIFDKIFANPNGIILVTGPTGSGKSTTLYTALSEMSTEEVNIVTVEDPVEANIDGVSQVNTNVKAGLTFANVLRSILRQDPDIIMIGEIRDQETAEIAVQAAITGHLVVSTLHTNSAAASVTRLVNIGIEPYLVADSLVGVVAQRLVRRLCPKCKIEKTATERDIADLGLKPGVNVKIYDKCGCAYCNNTGYQGRIAVYEIMDVDSDIKSMIVSNASTAEIKKVAIERGMHTLRRSAATLVLQGITTVAEMKKVSSEK